MRSHRTTRVLVTGVALAAWTAFAGIYANFGRFLISDTSCDGGELRPSTFGLLYLVVVAAVWMIPIIVLAVRRRSPATTVLAVIAAVAATVTVLAIAARVGEFCF
jgi:hypothetical protein